MFRAPAVFDTSSSHRGIQTDSFLLFWFDYRPVRQHDGIKRFIYPGFLERYKRERGRFNTDLSVRDL
jgi:hypothetical protein